MSKSIRIARRNETVFFAIILPAIAAATIALWAGAASAETNGSGIVKGPSLSFAPAAKSRSCQIVERQDNKGNTRRQMVCTTVQRGKR